MLAEGPDESMKSATRGTSLRKYDATNKILCILWMDNEVVSLTSSLQISMMAPVQQYSRLNLLNLKVEKALKAYQDGMDGIDRCEQYQENGSGFASKHITRSGIKRLTLQ